MPNPPSGRKPAAADIDAARRPPDRNQLAEAIESLADAVHRSGLVNPHRLGRRARSDPPRDEVLPERASPEEVVSTLAAIERIVNPLRLPFGRPERVGWLLDLSDREQARYFDEGRTDEGRPDPTPWFDGFSVAAVAVHGMAQWWNLEDISTAETPLARTTDRAVSRAAGADMLALPIDAVRQLGIVAAGIRTNTPPDFRRPHARVLSPGNLQAAHSAAVNVVQEVAAIHRLAASHGGRRSDDLLLLWRLGRVNELAASIPSAGWEPAFAGRAFRADGVSGRCAHLAAIKLADRTGVIAFASAIGAVQRQLWGRTVAAPAPLGWLAEARGHLAEELATRPPPDVAFWADQLAVEFERIHASFASDGKHAPNVRGAVGNGTPIATPIAINTQSITLTAAEAAVLRVLRTKSVNTLLVDLTEAAGLSKATVAAAVNSLERKGLAHRPAGKRKGVAATATGRGFDADAADSGT